MRACAKDTLCSVIFDLSIVSPVRTSKLNHKWPPLPESPYAVLRLIQSPPFCLHSYSITLTKYLFIWGSGHCSFSSSYLLPRQHSAYSCFPISVYLMKRINKCVKWSEVAQSCPTLCDPVGCSPPGSSTHGILQARILEWVAISFSSWSSRPRDQTQVSRIADRCFNLWATWEAKKINV